MSTVEYPLRTFLDVGPANLPEDEWSALNYWTGMTTPFLVIRYDQGCFVWVEEDEFVPDTVDAFPNICNVLLYAKSQGAAYVRFDADADPLTHLVQFEW